MTSRRLFLVRQSSVLNFDLRPGGWADDITGGDSLASCGHVLIKVRGDTGNFIPTAINPLPHFDLGFLGRFLVGAVEFDPTSPRPISLGAN